MAAEPAHLAYWLLQAVIWKKGQPLDFDGILRSGEPCRREVLFEPHLVGARGPTDDEVELEMQAVVVRIVIPDDPAPSLKGEERKRELPMRFAVAKKRMIGGREDDAPFWIVYDKTEQPADFIARLIKLGLAGHEIAYLICRTRIAEDVIPDAPQVVLRLHTIRDNLPRV